MTDIVKTVLMGILLLIGVYFAVSAAVDTALQRHDTRTYLWAYRSHDKFVSYLGCLHHTGETNAYGITWPTSEICSQLNNDFEGQLSIWAGR